MTMRVVAVPAVGAVPARPSLETVAGDGRWEAGQAPRALDVRYDLTVGHHMHCFAWGLGWLLPAGQPEPQALEATARVRRLGLARLRVSRSPTVAPEVVTYLDQLPAEPTRPLTLAGRPLDVGSHEPIDVGVRTASLEPLPAPLIVSTRLRALVTRAPVT